MPRHQERSPAAKKRDAPPSTPTTPHHPAISTRQQPHHQRQRPESGAQQAQNTSMSAALGAIGSDIRSTTSSESAGNSYRIAVGRSISHASSTSSNQVGAKEVSKLSSLAESPELLFITINIPATTLPHRVTEICMVQ